MATSALTQQQQEYLREIGLARHAILLYDMLLARQNLTASQAADRINNFPSAQYRLFYQLEAYGLVRRIKGRPVRFEPVSPETALPASYAIKEAQLKRLLQMNQTTEGEEVQMRIIIGRQALYDEFALLAPKARRSIRTYTIGIAYSEKFVAIMRAAVKRGVQVRMVAQQLKPSNYHVLHKWRSLGMNVRLIPSERGFHLMLFDNRTAIITFSNPVNTEDRISIVTDSQAVIKQFDGYYETIWQNAREIDV